ncbi:HCP-like protein [Coccomyxa subellipsoidea C-169]|uniref:HCP-like protein n=1 Tax=Coccomyxa subellipsoidea (strain C-169) TaxID=574566 RepID=I0Z0C9_COCSC|nr:HCP-like protein [Coccomyxa subellipsoidea C-169]EIE24098.1 HCP-like protein [Coccomyxa subellipsoidea C-169]|eukprot:XP_005648642.1 HCP-like protein [Coccomyxa subellipsoidea C-169]
MVAILAGQMILAAHGTEVDTSLPQQQYEKAVDLRSKKDASAKQLRQAADLLKSAAGVSLGVSMAVEETALNATDAEGSGAHDDVLSSHFSGLEIADNGHVGAIKELAVCYELGEGVLFNPAVSFELLRTAAERGDPEAQAELGFRLAIGIYPPPQDAADPLPLFQLGQARWPEALAHYFFAAAGNDSFARAALGYRHMHGLGVPKSCQTAVLYYQPVAEQVVELARQPASLPYVERMRLSAGASWRGHPTREQQVLHYQWFADLGSAEAQRALGQMLTQGVQRDPEQAFRYFRQAAEAGDADAMAHLGHMYANGVGVAASNESALDWFDRAARRNHPSGQYGLGYLHLSGYGVPKDAKKAFKYFTSASEQGHVESWFHLGVMHLNGWGTKANAQQALTFFNMASKLGHVLAQYNLAMLHLQGSAADKGGCTAALELLKKIAERGPWAAVLQEAFDWYRTGDYEGAVVAYLKAAEMGLEVGQSNAAWMLSRGFGAAGPTASALAQKLHQRAAGQGNVDALLQLGDSHWYGRGAERNWARAAQLYQTASKFRNAQALFNLGFMHEFGAGLPQDLHLAKRFYDKSLEAQPDATAPVQVALLSLALHSWWESVRPHVPMALHWLSSRIYNISDPGPGPEALALGAVPRRDSVGLGLGWLERAVDTAGRAWHGADRGAMGDTVESVLLLALCGCLWLVLWRRRNLRAGQQQGLGGNPVVPGQQQPRVAVLGQRQPQGGEGQQRAQQQQQQQPEGQQPRPETEPQAQADA